MNWLDGVTAILLPALLACAAWNDVATRIIPNQICFAVAGIGIAARLLTGPAALLASVSVACALFLFLVMLHARGMLGGGDVKLTAAICLGLPPGSAYRFIVVTALAGGVLSLLHLLGRRALRDAAPSRPPKPGSSLVKRVFFAERWRIARHGSLSYGVAIACGGIWAVLEGRGN